MGTRLNTIPQTEKELNELLQNIYLEDLSVETIKKLEKYRQKLKTDIIRK